jgi:uncharacterized protein (TIGR03067 family)
MNSSIPILAQTLMMATILGLCGAVSSDSGHADLEGLQGTWTQTAWEFAGRTIPGDLLDKHRVTLVIKGDTLTETAKGHENEPSSCTIKLNPDKSPKEVDFVDKNPDPGQLPAVFLGIYKLEGDTFTECMSRAGQPRPTEFKSVDKNTQVRTFRRVKE